MLLSEHLPLCQPPPLHSCHELHCDYQNQFYPTLYPQWHQFHKKSRISKFFILWTLISMWFCYALFYDTFLCISTCPKTLGLCLLELWNVWNQWNLYSFRLSIEVSLHLFVPTELSLLEKFPCISLKRDILSP